MRLLPLFLLVAFQARPQPPAHAKGFDHFYNLEYDEALREFTRATQERPDAPGPNNYLAATLLYREMFRSGALESELVSGTNPFLQRAKITPDPVDERRFDAAVSRVIELTTARLNENPKDAQALYAQGIAHGLRANYNFLVRKAWMDALRDATTARRLHNQVTEIDAGMIDARLVQGIHDYVVGSLPFTYRFLGFVIGFRGDREAGIRAVQLVAEKGVNNRVDAQVLLAVIYRRDRKPQLAIPLLDELIRKYPRNYLFRFELVQMYADAGDKLHALEVLRTMEQLKARKEPGYTRLTAEKIYYSRGNLLFWYREFDEALANLARVTANAKELDLNTATFAWLRTGQIHDLQGRRNPALDAYRQAIALAPDSDAARESRRYLETPYKREKV